LTKEWNIVTADACEIDRGQRDPCVSHASILFSFIDISICVTSAKSRTFLAWKHGQMIDRRQAE
jgi:hypothetical protein